MTHGAHCYDNGTLICGWPEQHKDKTMSKVWIVSFQDGENPTYVVLDEKPVVMLVDTNDLDNPNFIVPSECTDTDHIHIRDLIEKSHWNDTCDDVRTEAQDAS